MRVLFATAELSPLASVGGLGEAASGLARELQSLGVELEIVLPDYSAQPLEGESVRPLDLPAWAAPGRARSGRAGGFERVTLVDLPGIRRPHPYNDPASGEGWPDNDQRFFAFASAIAALAAERGPDVLHLNDWHTAATLGMLQPRPPALLTIHTLGYQGWSPARWLSTLPYGAGEYAWDGGCNPLAGAIALADRVATVSANYAREILEPEHGFGLHERLRALDGRLAGIRNGIDTTIWNPAIDEHLPARYDASDLEGKRACRAALLAELGWAEDAPLIGMVSRLTWQKGIDLVLDAVPFLRGMGARLVLLGAGERALAARAEALAASMPDVFRFQEGYDVALSHRIMAGADLFLMPSRFEPCGLAQMQAMAYGTLPVVTDVGGLHDTVRDDDDARGQGTGFVARSVEVAAFVDAMHRALRAWRSPRRRDAIRRRGMTADWSWRAPAQEYLALYEALYEALHETLPEALPGSPEGARQEPPA